MSVTLGVIHGDDMESLFVRDLVELIRQRDEQIDGVIFVGGGQGRLDNARNEVAARFLARDSDYLLTIDTDMTFTPEDFDTLLKSAADIVSGIYFVDSVPPRPAMANIIEGWVKAPDEWADGIIDVGYVGAGFMLIAREVLEVIDHPYRQDILAPNGDLVGEDYALCHRALEKGFKVQVNTDVFLGHIKPRVLGAER